MSAVTFHGVCAPAPKTAAAPRRKGLFARLFDAMTEARMREAARQIDMHLGYLPEDVRQRYRGAVRNSQQELPFGR